MRIASHSTVHPARRCSDSRAITLKTISQAEGLLEGWFQATSTGIASSRALTLQSDRYALRDQSCHWQTGGCMLPPWPKHMSMRSMSCALCYQSLLETLAKAGCWSQTSKRTGTISGGSLRPRTTRNVGITATEATFPLHRPKHYATPIQRALPNSVLQGAQLPDEEAGTIEDWGPPQSGHRTSLVSVLNLTCTPRVLNLSVLHTLRALLF